MDEQSLKTNSVIQDFFKIGVKCMSLCKTEFTQQLLPEQKYCLQTCGYNRAYLVHNIRNIVQNVVNLSLQ